MRSQKIGQLDKRTLHVDNFRAFDTEKKIIFSERLRIRWIRTGLVIMKNHVSYCIIDNCPRKMKKILKLIPFSMAQVFSLMGNKVELNLKSFYCPLKTACNTIF